MIFKKSTRLVSVLTMFFSFFVTFVASAQNKELRGLILDENGGPMCCVNVVLLSIPDSTYIQGTTSNMDGQFSMIAQKEGVIKFSCIGYDTQYIPSNKLSGKIQMRENSQLIKEIIVKGMLPKTKLTGNSMVTTIEGTVLGQSGSAKEMLSKVPGMVQNGDELQVIGRGAPIYYINGRQMQDPDELQRLRSEDIKEIEVINNPGAQYDATVSAVVRIKTKKRQGEGFGFDTEVGNQQDLYYGYTSPKATLNLHYRHNSFELFGGINYAKIDALLDSKPEQWSYLGKADSLISIEQKSAILNDVHVQGIVSHIGLDWQLSENHSVGMRFERKDPFNYYINFAQTTQTKTTDYQTGKVFNEDNNQNTQRGNSSQPYNWNGNTYYNGRIGKLGIDLNIDFVTNKSEDNNKIKEWDKSKETQMATATSTTSSMIADKLIFTYPIWKGLLSLGEEISVVSRKSKYAVENLPISNTDSKVKEDNISAFAEYAFALPKLGSFNVGVRFEYVGMKYSNFLDPQKSTSRYTNDVFPSISWAQQWGSVQTSLSYSFKTNRPNFKSLDETMIYVNPYTRQQGDPKLKNEIRQDISATARWKWLMLGAVYQKIDDHLTQWSYIYDDNGVILIKDTNLDSPVRNLTAYVVAYPTFGCFSPSWTIGLQVPNMKQTLADPREPNGKRHVSYTRPIYFASLNNAIRLKHSWQFEGNLSFQSTGDAVNFRLHNSTLVVNLVAQKSWLKNDALCLRATVSDIFQRSSQKIEMDCGYYLMQQSSLNNNHYLNVSLRYSFNLTKNKYRGTGAGESQKSRMDAQRE
ncbi:MAG: outer membrane beta-barrel protein [Bacteroidaceae bacterium]|nr:outer membrane beta-barrel protein [Bacteroidaceae bacterium]